MTSRSPWATAERAVASIQVRDRKLHVVSIDKLRTIRLEHKEFLGWFPIGR